MYPTRRARAGSSFRRFLLSGAASTSNTSYRNYDISLHPSTTSPIHSSLWQFITYFEQRHGYKVLRPNYRCFSLDPKDGESSTNRSMANVENLENEVTETSTSIRTKGTDKLSGFTTASFSSSQHPKVQTEIATSHPEILSQVRTDDTQIAAATVSTDTSGDEHFTTLRSKESVSENAIAATPSTLAVPADTSTSESLITSHLPNQDSAKPLTENTKRPQFVERELNQLRKQLRNVMEVLDSTKHHESQNTTSVTDSTVSTDPTLSFDHPINYLDRTIEPDLPPITAPQNMQYSTIEAILSLPLSAWDDDVWNQGRLIFVRRFQSHCSSLVHSEQRHQQYNSSSTQSPLSPSYNEATTALTINEVQETLNLLHRLCQVRSDTKQLHSLMNHFFSEVRVVIELQKHNKLSNKQLRNEFQYHPSFVSNVMPHDMNRTSDPNTIKLDKYSTKKDDVSNHFNSISLGTVAHMIEVMVYQIMKNRYWHPDTTTAYQTMIQVAAIATVDHKMYSTATSIHHNPGANAEYWLKQQHQASRMNSQQQTLHSGSKNLHSINAPNRYDYATVLEGWVATSKIEQLYQNTYNPYDVSQHPSVMPLPNHNLDNFMTTTDLSSPSSSPSLFSYNSNDSTAANRAGQLIRQWQFLYSSSENNPVLKPSEVAYSNWLLCIVNGGTRTTKGAAINAARECHNALKEISKRSEKDNFWPGVTLYNILMNAYSKAGDPEAAEAVLHDLIEKAKYNTYCVPDVVSFTTVINAWAQIPHNPAAPDRAERLFHLQQDFATRSGLESLLPTATTVTAVLQCWVKSNHPLAPSRAEAILKQMHDMVRAGYPKLQPNVITYNICMNIWWRSGHCDASNKVEELFQELIVQYRASRYALRFKPDVATYIARLSAWERNRTLTARAIAEKIESIFNELLSPVEPLSTAEKANVDEMEKLRPNHAIYNIIIRAFSNCGDAVTATKYLEAMITDYVDNKNYKAIPNRFVFHFVISAWSKKLSYTGAETAEWWLNRMHHLSTSHPGLKDIAPNSVSYNTCLGAWARFPQGRMIIDTDPNIEAALYQLNDDRSDTVHQEVNSHQTQPLQSSTMTKCPTVIAMERGQDLFHRMKQNNIRPDVYTYGALLQIISNQKQCTKHIKYSQAQSIVEKMVRDNTEMNAYIFRLLKKCGMNRLPNYNLNYNQQNSRNATRSNKGDGLHATSETTNRSMPGDDEPLHEKTAEANEIAETLQATTSP